MKNMKKRYLIIWVAILSILVVGCINNEDETEEVLTEVSTETEESYQISDETGRPEGWEDVSHSKGEIANYEVVFPEEKVNRIDLVLSSENWTAMLDDMTENYGEFGTNENIESSGEDPIWKSCSFKFNDQEWWNVGIRFKGNSSLISAWKQGNMKLPMRFNFDKFEDDYEEIKNQRFYGFKKLTLSSNFSDTSLMREKVIADIYRDSGVPAPRTAFYRVYIDYGEGEKYFGLYTMIELPEDEMLEQQFSNEDGNLYKPEGTASSFREGSLSSDNYVDFDKKTNESDDDYSDIQKLYDALHSDQSDKAVWRAELENILDVDEFLNWLALNTVMQNWDTYGNMEHNFYLYNNPDSEKFQWIPWDNNEGLNSFENPNPIDPNRIDIPNNREEITSQKSPLSLNLTAEEVNDDWPLIRFLIDDEVYKEKYINSIKGFVDGEFDSDTVKLRYEKAYNLIKDYVVGENGEQIGYTFLRQEEDFENEYNYLKEHVVNRNEDVVNYLEENEK